ncbi:phage capsid protein [Cereibacter sphaeroides]|uniref:phage capsid protein n=1 Tax=Cereibacter sphaeroides TaxID=1063 RepID=UPI000E5B27CE|nr:phage capsid protein [Cereibacter sphaeroides]RHZ99080.1 phage capsid protein [Cereibacter sphaeroides]
MARQNLDDLRRARKAAADMMAAVTARIGALGATETPDAAASSLRPSPSPKPMPP